MCTAFTHAFVALAAGKAGFPGRMSPKFWVLAIACSAGPDLDVGLMHYGVEYGDLWGHRGMTHSLLFAALLAVFVVSFFFWREARPLGRRWWGLLAFFFLLTASHGFIDAFTNGGLGIAFFAPFDETRYFMPFTPIEVSAIGLRGFLKYGGGATLLSEFLWIWLPTVVLATGVIAARRLIRSRVTVAPETLSDS